MGFHRVTRPMLGLGAVVGLVGAPLAALVLTAAPANATDSDGGVFRTAWANQTTGTISLSVDVTLGCTDLAGDGTALRTLATPIVVDGHGHSITQTCTTGTNNGVLTQNGNGAVTLQNLTITGGNAGNGGGVLDFGSDGLTITNSTISGNHSVNDAAGVLSVGTLTVTNSTITGNSTTAFGGGLDGDHSVIVTNSTITGNTAGNGAAVVTSNSGDVTLVYATVVQNTATKGAIVATFGLTSFGSVVAQPQGGGTNCESGVTTTSHGFNFTDDANATTGCKFNAATDHVGASNNPLLGPLANNGGPTLTKLPQDGPSPLIDAIPAASCQADGASGITTDQRLLPRPDPGSPNCDIGAVEVQVPGATAAPVAPTLIVAFTG